MLSQICSLQVKEEREFEVSRLSFPVWKGAWPQTGTQLLSAVSNLQGILKTVVFRGILLSWAKSTEFIWEFWNAESLYRNSKPRRNNQAPFNAVILLQLILIHCFPSSYLPPQALIPRNIRQDYLSGRILRYFVDSMQCSPPYLKPS